MDIAWCNTIINSKIFYNFIDTHKWILPTCIEFGNVCFRLGLEVFTTKSTATTTDFTRLISFFLECLINIENQDVPINFQNVE